MHYKLIAILILVGLVVLFIVQNVAVVEIQFLFWAIQMPRCPDAQIIDDLPGVGYGYDYRVVPEQLSRQAGRS